MKVVRYIIIFSCILLRVSGQQLPMYNHYFFKPFYYNPAFAGRNDNIEAMVLNRSQWTGFSGAPQLNLLIVDGTIKEQKAAVGLTVVSDRRGINTRTGTSLAYSYRLKFKEEFFLQFGLSAGVISNSIDYAKAISESANDPTLFFTNQQKSALDFNAGFVLCWKGLEAAVSAPQLAGNKINYADNVSTIKTWYRQERHYVASLKYGFTLSDPKQIILSPQAVMRLIPGTPLQYDAGLNLEWKNYCWLGAMYKSAYGFSANAGITLNKSVDIGYSYEFISGSLSKYSGMSHEIVVRYRFIKYAKKEIVDPQRQDTVTNYTHVLDSLQQELENSNSKISQSERKVTELTKMLEQLKAQQQIQKTTYGNGDNNIQNTNSATAQNNGMNNNNVNSSVGSTDNKATTQNNINNNQASGMTGTVTEPATSKVMEDNIWIVVTKANECKTPSGSSPAKGYYVISGTFFYQDFAMNESKRLKSNGYPGAGWMYSNSKQYNYVYIQKYTSKQEAVSAAKKAQSNGIKDAWVKILE